MAPGLEEDETDDEMSLLASDDDFSEFDDEMTESDDLKTEDVVGVADILQEDSNGEQDTSSASDSTQHDIGESQFNCSDWTYNSNNRVWWVGPPTELPDTIEDFSDYDTYYLLVNSLERIQERSHHANPSPQIRDISDSRVGHPLRGSLKEGSELLFHFCHSRDCQGMTSEPCVAVPSETHVPNPNGNTDPDPIATQTEGEVIENDIPRDSEEEGNVNDEMDEAPQEQVQPPTSPSAEPEMDLSVPPKGLNIVV